MTSVDAITNILNEQLSNYKMLLELLQKERVCLMDMNAECIEELSKSKDTLLLKLRLLEEERRRLMKDYGDITLQNLAEVTDRTILLELRSKLKSLCQSIEELNSLNRMLIERSLCFVKNATMFLDSFGVNINSRNNRTIVSREA